MYIFIYGLVYNAGYKQLCKQSVNSCTLITCTPSVTIDIMFLDIAFFFNADLQNQ